MNADLTVLIAGCLGMVFVLGLALGAALDRLLVSGLQRELQAIERRLRATQLDVELIYAGQDRRRQVDPGNVSSSPSRT